MWLWLFCRSARMVASHLNRQIILLLKRPLTHYWSFPLKQWVAFTAPQCSLSFTGGRTRGERLSYLHHVARQRLRGQRGCGRHSQERKTQDGPALVHTRLPPLLPGGIRGTLARGAQDLSRLSIRLSEEGPAGFMMFETLCLDRNAWNGHKRASEQWKDMALKWEELVNGLKYGDVPPMEFSKSSAESQKGVNAVPTMFCWDPEGRYCHRSCTAITPFWF